MSNHKMLFGYRDVGSNSHVWVDQVAWKWYYNLPNFPVILGRLSGRAILSGKVFGSSDDPAEYATQQHFFIGLN